MVGLLIAVFSSDEMTRILQLGYVDRHLQTWLDTWIVDRHLQFQPIIIIQTWLHCVLFFCGREYMVALRTLNRNGFEMNRIIQLGT